MKWTTQSFVEEMEKRSPNIKIIGEYVNSSTIVAGSVKKDNCEIQRDVHRKVLKGAGRSTKTSDFKSIRAQTQFRRIMTPLYG